jgi:tRNA dimethylallyltransferase
VKPVVIAGPTGAGKSALALALAQALGGEIVNYDSVQAVRGFDIGSAKPSPREREIVPHHLFDVVEAGEELNAAEYGRLARDTNAEIDSRGRRAIFVGGTFFYLRAFLSGLPEMPGRDENVRARIRAIAAKPRGASRLHHWLRRVDPVSASRIAMADRHRVERALEVWIAGGRPISSWEREPSGEIPSIKIALKLSRERLTEGLDARVESMYKAGLVEETRSLLEHHAPHARPFGTIGYKEAAAVVHGQLGLAEAIAETKRRTRAYAKRQMTWLRSERNVHWIDATDRDDIFAAAMRLIEVES